MGLGAWMRMGLCIIGPPMFGHVGLGIVDGGGLVSLELGMGGNTIRE